MTNLFSIQQRTRNTGIGLLTLIVLAVGCQENNSGVEAQPGLLPDTDGLATQPRVDAATHYAYGHLLEQQEHFEQALEQYRMAIESGTDYYAAINRRGIVLNKLGRHREATDSFIKASEMAPSNAHLFNNLGFSLYLENRLPEAEIALGRSIDIRPDFGKARMNLAVVLAKLGRYQEALEQFAQVGGEADAHFNLAVIQTDAGDYLAAIEQLNTALELNPELDEARDQLRTIAVLAAREERQRRLNEADDLLDTETPSESADGTRVVELDLNADGKSYLVPPSAIEDYPQTSSIASYLFANPSLSLDTSTLSVFDAVFDALCLEIALTENPWFVTDTVTTTAWPGEEFVALLSPEERAALRLLGDDVTWQGIADYGADTDLATPREPTSQLVFGGYADELDVDGSVIESTGTSGATFESSFSFLDIDYANPNGLSLLDSGNYIDQLLTNEQLFDGNPEATTFELDPKHPWRVITPDTAAPTTGDVQSGQQIGGIWDQFADDFSSWLGEFGTETSSEDEQPDPFAGAPQTSSLE